MTTNQIELMRGKESRMLEDLSCVLGGWVVYWQCHEHLVIAFSSDLLWQSLTFRYSADSLKSDRFMFLIILMTHANVLHFLVFFFCCFLKHSLCCLICLHVCILVT
ncbi:hypothetical protein GW17_00002967 [Ensete ventricosum]|nr:hypothetical protein GW17_00002967 [Ensete ventricosum]